MGAIYPRSESGTCFRTNRSCRLLPAHQGMKTRPGQGLGLFGAAPPLWIPAPYRGTGHASDRRNDEFGAGMTRFARVPGTRTHDGKRLFSYQSLMPVGAGTPKYEKPELWLGTANWHDGFCHAPPRPLRGTSPRATFSHSAIDHQSTVRHVSPAESRDGGRLEGASRIGVRDMLSYQ